MSRLAPNWIRGEPVLDRLAPDTGSVVVTNSPTVTATLDDVTSITQDGRDDVSVSDTFTRRLLEKILVRLDELVELSRR